MSAVLELSTPYTPHATWASALRPLPDLTVSEWADKYRILPPEESEGGPWRTDRFPPLRRIMDVLSPSHPCETVVLMKSEQVGGTEVGMNWQGCTTHLEPGRFMIVHPTTQSMIRHSKSRIAKMISSTPVLKTLIKPPRKRDSGNTLLIKDYPGGSCIMTGANSDVGISSTPIRYAHLDEVDKYPVDVDNAGDTIAVIDGRMRTYRGKRKKYLSSTPKDAETSRIEPAYEDSTKERYHVPCPVCLHWQPLDWAQVKWEPGKPKTAQYECIDCKERIPEGHKAWMLSEGEWVAENPDHPIIGFHLSALYSPWMSWAEMAIDFLKSKDDPVLLKAFTNLKLGETWKETATLDASNVGLARRCESYGAEVPERVVVLTAGVDVQDDRLEIEIAGWAEGEEFFSLAHEKLWGDPSGTEVWNVLDEVLKTPLSDLAGLPHYIQATGVDSGGHHTLQVYNFVRPRARRRVWAIKGRAGAHPVWPREPSRNNKGKVDLYLVGVDAAKEAIYSRLKTPGDGPGKMHFPLGYGDDYFSQLTAEYQKTKLIKGRKVVEWWQKKGRANEVLDTVVYAYAALQGLITQGYHWQPMHRLAQSHEPTPHAAAAPRERSYAEPEPQQRPVSQPSRAQQGYSSFVGRPRYS